MLLLFSVVHPADGNVRPLVFYSKQLEQSLDLLNYFVNAGFTIESAVICEPGKADIPLPLEAIDGKPMKEYMQQLQEEWEEILRKRS